MLQAAPQTRRGFRIRAHPVRAKAAPFPPRRDESDVSGWRNDMVMSENKSAGQFSRIRRSCKSKRGAVLTNRQVIRSSDIPVATCEILVATGMSPLLIGLPSAVRLMIPGFARCRGPVHFYQIAGFQGGGDDGGETMQGSRSSRETMAEWESRLPRSTSSPAAAGKSTTQPGSVWRATRISPGSNLAPRGSRRHGRDR